MKDKHFGDSANLRTINRKLDKLIMKVSELVAALETVRVQLKKSSDEILKKIADLSAGDPDLSPETLAKLAELKADVQALDDIVPDAVPTPDPAPEPEPPTPEPPPEA